MTAPNTNGGGHVNDLELAAYLDRRLTGSARERVEAHLAACPECRHELAQSHRLIQRVRRPRRLVAMGLVGAAAAVILLALPGSQPGPGPVVDTRLRQGGPSQTVVAYSPMGETSRNGIRFVWALIPEATTYRVTLSRPDGRPIWSAASTDTVLSLPDSVPLTVGEHYLWAADALLADGRTRSTGLREFVATP